MYLPHRVALLVNQAAGYDISKKHNTKHKHKGKHASKSKKISKQVNKRVSLQGGSKNLNPFCILKLIFTLIVRNN